MVKGPGHAIVSDRLFTELRFYKTVSIGTSPGSLKTIDVKFLGNSVYDCDADVTPQTFSALGLLKLGSLYNNFRVHGSKLTAKYMSTANLSQNYAKIAIAPSTSKLNTGANILSRFPYAKTRLLGGSVGNNVAVMSQYMSTKKMFGLKDISTVADLAGRANSLDSGTTAAPTRQWYWHIATDSINGTNALDGSIFVDVEMVYYVEFFNRVHIQTQDLDDDEVPLEADGTE